MDGGLNGQIGRFVSLEDGGHLVEFGVAGFHNVPDIQGALQQLLSNGVDGHAADLNGHIAVHLLKPLDRSGQDFVEQLILHQSNPQYAADALADVLAPAG